MLLQVDSGETIGSSANPLTLKSSTLKIDGTPLGVFADNTGALTITGSAITAGSEGIHITTHSPLTVDTTLNSVGGDIELAALGSLATDVMTITGAITASGGNGSIRLWAGNNILHQSGAISTVGTGSIQFLAGVNRGTETTTAAIPAAGYSNGSVNQSGGSITSANGNISIRATGDVTARAVSSTGGTIALGADANFADIIGGGIARDGSGAVTVNGNITLNNKALNISGATFSQTSGTINAGNAAGGLTTIDITGVGNQTGGVISGTGGLTKQGSGTLTLNSANTYSGATTIDAGTLMFSGASGAAASSSGFTVNGGGRLTLDNSTNIASGRIGTAGLTLNGGAFKFIGGTALTVETIGALTLGAGFSTVELVKNDGTVALTSAGLTRSAGGTVNFIGTNVPLDSSANQMIFTSTPTPTNNILPYAIVNGADWATTNVNNLIAYSSYYTGDINTAASTDNVKLSASSPSLILSGTKTINSLLISDNSTLNTNGFALTVGTGSGQAGVLTTATGAGISGATGTLAFGGAEGIVFTQGSGGNSTATVSAAIYGSAGLTQAGTGTLTLSGTNTYTGATTIGGGKLSISEDSNLGIAPITETPGYLTLNGGTLAATDSFELDMNRGIDLTGVGGTFDMSAIAVDMNYGGTITGAGTLTKIGTGVLTFGGSNTYTGATTINGGKLVIGADAGLGTAPGTPTPGHLTFNNGILEVRSVSAVTLNANRGIDLLAGGGTIETGNTTNYAGSIVGSGTLTKGLTGTLLLSGINAYTGLTNVTAGTLRLSGGAAIANAGAVQLSSSIISTVTRFGILRLDSNETIGSLAGIAGTPGTQVVLGSNTLTTGDASSTTFAGVISGIGGGITKQGTGTFTLSGANSYTGATNVNVGVLSLQNGAAAGNAAGGVTVANGAALELQGGITVGAETLSLTGMGIGGMGALLNVSNNNIWGGTVTLADHATIGSTAGTLTLSAANAVTATNKNLTFAGAGNGAISGTITTGSGTLTKDGAGMLTLSGENTYSGLTTINEGTLKLGAGGGATNTPLGTTGAGTVVTAGATLDLNGFTLGTAEALTLNGTGIASGGALSNSSATAATYSGLIALSSASSIVASNGNLILSNTGTITGSGFGLTLGGTNSASSLASIIGTGAGTVTKIGSGTWTLFGANTYTGTTDVNVGVLDLRNAAAAGSGTVAVADGAAVQIQGGITVANALTLNGTGVSSGGALRSISGANTWSGAISQGSASRINTDLNSLALTGGIGNGGLLLTVGGAGNTAITTTALSGTGGLTKDDAGTLTLGVANSYAGATSITTGTLAVTVNNALGTNAAGTTVASGATLDLRNVAYSTTEGLTLNGGTLATSTGPSSFAGAITLQAASAITVADATTLTLAGAINGGFNLGVTAGTGSIVFDGAIGGGTSLGALTVSAQNVTVNGTVTASGTTTLNAATVNLNANVTNTVTGTVATTVNVTAPGQIQDGIDVAASGGTVNVAAGTYTLSTRLDVNKPLILRGAQYGIDPRNAAPPLPVPPLPAALRTAGSAAETIVDGGNALATLLRIGGNNVTIDGFEFRNGTGDLIESVVAILNPTVRYNLIHHSVGPGDEGVQIRNSTSAILEYNRVYDTVGDGLNIADSTNGTIRFNEVHDNSSVNAAIYVYGSTNTTIEGNYVHDVLIKEGIKLGDSGGGDVARSGGSIIDNVVDNTASDGITVYTSNVTVSGNQVSNSQSQDGAIFVYYDVNNIAIQNNTISNNGNTSDGAVTYAIRVGSGTKKPTNVTISGNTFVNNEAQLFDNNGAGQIATIFSANTFDRSVMTSGDNRIWSRIQDGINVAASGGTVTVGTGTTYTEAVDISTNNVTMKLAGNATISSLADAAATTFVDLQSFRLTTGNATNTQYDGVISGIGGSLTKTGNGSFTLTGNNSYTGLTTVSTGTLAVTADNALGTNAQGTTVANGATLDLQGVAYNTTEAVILQNGATLATSIGASSLAGTVTLTTAGVFSVGGTQLSLSGVVGETGASTLTKTGVGVLALSGNNSYTGATTISVGTLQAGHANALGTTAGGVTVANNATLELQGNITMGAEALSIIGTGVGGSGALRNLSGANIWGGTVTLAGNASIGSTAGTLTLNASNAVTGSNTNLTLAGAGNGAISGTITTGAGTLTKNDGGIWMLSGANTYTGATTISAGVLSVGALANGGNSSSIGQSAAAAANLVLNGGMLRYTGGNVSTDRAFTLANGTTSSIDITTAATNLTMSGASAATTGSFTKAGSGMLTLSGANGYTGLTTVSAGTLTLGHATNTLADSSTLAVSGGVLDLGGHTDTVAGVQLTGGTIQNGTLTSTTDYDLQTGTVNAVLAGSVGVIKNGSGILTLSNAANSFSGAVTLNAGTTSVAALADSGTSSSLGTGAGTPGIALGSVTAATLLYTGNTTNSNRALTLGGAGGGTLQMTAAGQTLTLS
ncbi:MAG: autotransporter-associated beta strand repeat-containing protein [Nitrosospira sp.]|nr:autotransporter-associated beta strand repeat-containing protein [Nitrosospira sp.]